MQIGNSDEGDWVFVDDMEQRKCGANKGVHRTSSPVFGYKSYDSTPLLDRSTPEIIPKKIVGDVNDKTDDGSGDSKNMRKSKNPFMKEVEEKWEKWDKILENLHQELRVMYTKADVKIETKLGRDMLASNLRDSMSAKKKEIIEYAGQSTIDWMKSTTYIDRSNRGHIEFAKKMGLHDFDGVEQFKVKQASPAGWKLKSPVVGKKKERKDENAQAEHKKSGLDRGLLVGLSGASMVLQASEAFTKFKSADVELAHPKPLPLKVARRIGFEDDLSLSTDHPFSPFNAAAFGKRENTTKTNSEAVKTSGNTSWMHVDKVEEGKGEKVKKHDKIRGYSTWKRVEKAEERKEKWEDDE